MSFDQTRDILRQLRVFHQRAGSLYEALRPYAETEMGNMLLDRLIKQERQMSEGLAKYEKTAPASVLNMFFQQSSLRRLSGLLDEIDIENIDTANDLLDIALDINTNLISVYHDLAESTMSDKVAQMFKGLLEMARTREKELSWFAG